VSGNVKCFGAHSQANDAIVAFKLRFSSACQVEYTPAQLDLLAILFTCIKVLYVGGAVGRTYQLIQVGKLGK
jgi:hypothetical protein